MPKRITSNFVNWVDGMKLSKEQFIAQERAVRDHLRDAVELGTSDIHYGLLEAVDVRFSAREIQLNACRAVCRDGSRIEFLPEQEQAVTYDLSPYQTGAHEGQGFFLLALAHAESTAGLGPYVGEPPRQETCVPRTSLVVITVDKLNAAALRSPMLPIARFSIQQGVATPAKDFLPPWFQIQGSADLEKLKQELEATIGVVTDGCRAVLAKLYDKPREDQVRFPNRNYAHWAVQTAGSLARIKADLLLGTERPFQLVRSVAELAHVIDGAWATMPEREEMMKLVEKIGNWAKLIRSMNASITRLATLRYQHWDLGPTCDLCTAFLEQVRLVYAQLGELNRFEPVTLMRDVPEATQQQVLKPKPPEPSGPTIEWT